MKETLKTGKIHYTIYENELVSGDPKVCRIVIKNKKYKSSPKLKKMDGLKFRKPFRGN